MYAFRLFQLLFAAPTLLTVGLVRLGELSLASAAFTSAALTISYLVSLWTSMLVYRAFFHRLHAFPGPPGAKLTKFWHVLQLGKCDNYKRLDKWHAAYGDYVRIGPNELSIVDPDAVEAVMGARSTCTKSAWYDMGDPLVSLHQCRDRATHDKRRRVWDRGFSMKGSSRLLLYSSVLSQF